MANIYIFCALISFLEEEENLKESSESTGEEVCHNGGSEDIKGKR
jgi:hypothetical protein